MRAHLVSGSLADWLIRFVAASLAIGLFGVILASNLSLSRYQHFAYLADSFRQGKLYFLSLPEPAWQDVALYSGRAFWPHGPLPAVLVMPFAAAAQPAGWPVRQGYLQIPLLAFIGLALYKLSRQAGLGQEAAAWLTFAFFTSHFLLVAMVPSSYYLAHVVAIAAMFAAWLEYKHKQRWWLIGLLCGLALLSRTPAGLFIIFFVLDRLRISSGKELAKDLSALILPFLICGAVFAWYNAARFGSIFEQGYSYQTAIEPELAQARAVGVLSLRHVPPNVYYSLFSLPEPVFKPGSHTLDFPYFAPSLWGMSLIVTSPYLLYLFKRRRLTKEEQNLGWTALAIAAPIWLFFGIGYQQFGYRYALDFLPPLFIMLALVLARADAKLPRAGKLAILGSAWLNLYLLLALYSVHFKPAA